MTLSGPFPLYLSSKQMAIELFTVLLPAPFLERISQVASTGVDEGNGDAESTVGSVTYAW
jgi:hypothetical protein